VTSVPRLDTFDGHLDLGSFRQNIRKLVFIPILKAKSCIVFATVPPSPHARLLTCRIECADCKLAARQRPSFVAVQERQLFRQV